MGYHVISFLSYFDYRNMHFFSASQIGRQEFYESSIGRHAGDLPPMQYSESMTQYIKNLNQIWYCYNKHLLGYHGSQLRILKKGGTFPKTLQKTIFAQHSLTLV